MITACNAPTVTYHDKTALVAVLIEATITVVVVVAFYCYNAGQDSLCHPGNHHQKVPSKYWLLKVMAEITNNYPR